MVLDEIKQANGSDLVRKERKIQIKSEKGKERKEISSFNFF
ncbi:hypothetical protein RG963_02105 [Methanosarcina sp. Z-7115]|uniref:Mobile element protein n=1 Tax=Methanosarcina baikalica TaxID=3073890 RepID=A0ABU2CXY5_9EURY|nr:hypothetical protein [Methanosarcina sp. Z-7115]MDR7664596.1 hypothetical protein [Methanosarcina sp. Z-7115]